MIGTLLDADTEIDSPVNTFDFLALFLCPIRVGKHLIVFGIPGVFGADTRVETGRGTYHEPILKIIGYRYRPRAVYGVLSGNDAFAFLVVFEKHAVK